MLIVEVVMIAGFSISSSVILILQLLSYYNKSVAGLLLLLCWRNGYWNRPVASADDAVVGAVHDKITKLVNVPRLFLWHTTVNTKYYACFYRLCYL